MNRQPNEEYLSTGQVESAIDDIEKTLLFLDRDPSRYKWKWISLTLTQALYLLSLFIIRHGDPFQSIPKRNRNKLQKQYESGEITEEKLQAKLHDPQYVFGKTISYSECLNWLQDSLHEKRSGLVRKLCPVSIEEFNAATSLRTLYRNKFVHMNCDGHGFQVSHLPEQCLLVIKLIEKVIDSDWFLMTGSRKEGMKAKPILASISQRLELQKGFFSN